nr:MAG TPA: hypothetical protein [Caudoviricetes sp.]
MKITQQIFIFAENTILHYFIINTYSYNHKLRK